MPTATVTPITKNLTTDDSRRARLPPAHGQRVDSPEFHRFLSSQFEKSSDGPEAA